MKEEILLENVIKIIDDIRVEDIVCFDFNEISPYYRYNVICTAFSDRMIDSAARHLAHFAYENNLDVKINGRKSVWVLVDLKDVIVNVFCEGERNRFALEDLYEKVPTVDIEAYL